MTMKTGLLWYDNDPKRTLAEKLTRAAAGYKKRTGKDANECHVPLTAIEKETTIDGIKVKPSRTVLEHHLWIGASEK